MAAINTAQQLAKVRSKIDAQQQIVDTLELELQKAILGDDTQTVGNILTEINNSYAGVPDGDTLQASVLEGLQNFGGTSGTVTGNTADQTILRQLLYQARAMLGELRIEEQHYNQEVQQEQNLRKSLIDLSKA